VDVDQSGAIAPHVVALNSASTYAVQSPAPTLSAGQQQLWTISTRGDSTLVAIIRGGVASTGAKLRILYLKGGVYVSAIMQFSVASAVHDDPGVMQVQAYIPGTSARIEYICGATGQTVSLETVEF
jgi:hypothetical protein